MELGQQIGANSEQRPGTPTEINQILRRKRKARERRACYPCRQRKVKCNYGTPCQRCIDRDHIELCTYQETLRASDAESSRNPPTSSGDSLQATQLWSKLNTVEQCLRDIKTEIRSRGFSPEDDSVLTRASQTDLSGAPGKSMQVQPRLLVGVPLMVVCWRRARCIWVTIQQLQLPWL